MPPNIRDKCPDTALIYYNVMVIQMKLELEVTREFVTQYYGNNAFIFSNEKLWTRLALNDDIIHYKQRCSLLQLRLIGCYFFADNVFKEIAMPVISFDPALLTRTLFVPTK